MDIASQSRRKSSAAERATRAPDRMFVERSDSEESTGKSSVDQLVMRVLKCVYDGQLAPGQKLIEGDMARMFGVGRGTVREALRRLEADGLVDASLHRGARIRSFNRDQVRDILEINENVFALAASLAAQRFERAKDVDVLREILESMSKCLDQGNEFDLAKLRFQFVRELVKLTKNGELRRHLPRMDVSIIRVQFRAISNLEMAADDVKNFGRIVKCILARDADGAAKIAREYTKAWASSIQQLPDDHFAS